MPACRRPVAVALVIAAGVWAYGSTSPATGRASAGQSAAASTTREERWRADLDLLAREFPPKQLDFTKLYPGGRFDAGIAAIKSGLATSTDADVVLALMRLVAAANVAHTTVNWPSGALAFHRLPLTVAWYSDGLAVTGAAEPYRSALGLRVTKVGMLTPEALEAAVAPYIAHENDVGLRQLSPSFMVAVEVLRKAGQVTSDGRVVFTLARPDGTSFVLPVAIDEGPTPPLISVTDALRIPTALFRKHPNAYYWYEVLPDARALYVQYNKCADDPNRPFAAFVTDVFADADANVIERVIVDLRFNSGGNSDVIRPLLDGLRARPKWIARGHLYALVGRATFSSGMLAAVNFRDDLHAILIGEPLGEKPNSYGEVRQITLPNSQLAVQYSTKFFRLLKNADPPAYVPDVIVLRTLADALAGRDPVLDAALTRVVR